MNIIKSTYFMHLVTVSHLVYFVVVVAAYISVSFAQLMWMPVNPLEWDAMFRFLLALGEIALWIYVAGTMSEYEESEPKA